MSEAPQPSTSQVFDDLTSLQQAPGQMPDGSSALAGDTNWVNLTDSSHAPVAVDTHALPPVVDVSALGHALGTEDAAHAAILHGTGHG